MNLKLETIGVIAVAGATHVFACPGNSDGTDKNPSFMLIEESQDIVDKPVEINRNQNSDHSGQGEFTRFERIEKWTAKLEKEFRNLAKKEAIGHISPGEAERLEFLDKERAGICSPRSHEEVLSAWQHDQVMETLNRALEKYVQYQQATNYKTNRSGKAD